MRYMVLLISVAIVPSLAEAQADQRIPNAAATISAENFARHVGVLADDSMMGRDTPSLGLERAAQYIAEQFKQLGLKPAAEGGNSWFQRYPIPGQFQLNYPASQLIFTIRDSLGRPGEKSTTINFVSAAYFAIDTAPVTGALGQLVAPLQSVILTGRHTPATLRKANVENRMVLYIPDARADSAARQQIVAQLYASNQVITLADDDSATFARRSQAALNRPVVGIEQDMERGMGEAPYWAANVWLPAVKDFLVNTGVDWETIRTDTTPVVRQVPFLNAWLKLKFSRKDSLTGVNVVGVLEGEKQNESILLSAHMDHTGIARGQPDSINNGANDNASGVAGLLELARAFQAGARPRRSIIFLVPSGGEKELWGSTFWAFHNHLNSSINANVNLDMIGRTTGDSIAIAGIPDLDFSVRPDWIARRHSELGVTLVDKGSVADSPQSDHMAFVRKRIPSLHFYNGTHDTTPGGDSPAAIDAERAARILQLVFYVSQELANADKRVSWNAEGRRKVSQLLGPLGRR